MPIFYRKAYEAACRGKIPPGLADAHFEDWQNLEQALLWLPTDEQRCDAVYGNWLMRLDAPGGAQQWDLVGHLIEGGGLDANYLAELAQNANDAADGGDAELRVKPEPGWLFVANNGRKVTPLNLIGLCDFFGHFALPVPGVLAIGTFGVGFKSSFRIADEIFVHTWAGGSSFTFRIPITVTGRPASHPNKSTLERVLSQLVAVGVHIAPQSVTLNYAGFCTPESLAEPPPQVVAAIASLATTPQGTLFCYHLHDEGSQEVARRIESQTENIYELCPLFVPYLRAIELGSYRMAMTLGQTEEVASPAGRIQIAKATLSVCGPGGRQSHVRFWRLIGAELGDKWQLALHADATFHLQVRRADDGQAASVRAGSAYAFFPLHNVVWPLKLHLHLALPTSLSRGDWAHGNFGESAAVEEQIGRAVRVMAHWLAVRHDLWHPEWRVEALFEQTPTQDQQWPRFLWKKLCETAQSVALLRCLWGGQTTTKSRTVRIISRDEARAAWQTLGTSVPQLREDCPLTECAMQTSFGQTELKSADVADLFEQARPLVSHDASLRRAFLSAFLSCQAQTISNLERILGPLPIELANGSSLTFRELLEQPAGAELDPEWHSTFRQVSAWSEQAEWRTASAFGRPLRDKLRLLSQSKIYVTWDELPTRMAEEGAWLTLGDQFWITPRNLCPTAKLASVTAAIRVPNGTGGWLLLLEAWIDDNSPADCFADRLKPWPIPSQNVTRQRITGLLREWGLFAEWERATKKMLETKLPGELTRRLTEQAGGNAFASIFNQSFEAARRGLDDGWRHIVDEAEKRAVTLFVHAQTTEGNLLGTTVLSASIAPTVCAALRLNTEFVPGPPWLIEAAYQRICRLGLQQNLGFHYLSQPDYLQRRATLVRNLLDQFYRWKDSAPSRDALDGLNEMAKDESRTNRRNWPVGFSPQRKPLLKELIHTQSAEEPATPADKLNRLMLQKAKWRNADPLPALLAQVPSIAEASVQSHTLQLEVPPLTLTPIERAQIPPAALKDGPVLELVEAGHHQFFTTVQALTLCWSQDGEPVATLPAADCVTDGDKLIFAHSLPPEELEPYKNILRAYEDNDRGSVEYRHDKEAGVSAYERFQKYHPVITKVLVESRVRAFGYQEQHILRELLQNAESAYASQKESSSPPEPWFELAITRLPGETGYRVTAMHEGRAFDEPDKHGNPRPDVDRIIMESAPVQNTEDEIGRFNRGFKSVFCAANNKGVRVESGGFNFVIQDLMLRFPAKPKRNAGPTSPVTKFSFETSRKDALALVGLDEPLGANPLLSLLNASSLIFLRYICRVTVRFENHNWTWKTTPGRQEGWQEVAFNPCGKCPSERFLVYHAPRLDAGGRFAAALRLGPTGLPIKLEPTWRCLRLTFETAEELNLDVLVNGQFEAEPGRRALINVPKCGLVGKALNTVIQRCVQDFAGGNATEEQWLAWARCFDLKNNMKGLAEKVLHPEAISTQVEEFLTQRIPYAGNLKPAKELDFPSKLMRRLESDGYCERWGIDTSNWISAKIAEQLPDTQRDELRFDDWLRNAQLPPPRLKAIQNAIATRQFWPVAQAFPAEIAKAKQLLEFRLRPARQFQVEEQWHVAELYQRWQDDNEKANNHLLEEYTLEGENWPLLYPDDSTAIAKRKEKLQNDLSHPETDEGGRIWYRLLGLACLMSAGWGRISTLREFWQGTLEPADFWNATAGKDKFANETRELFSKLVMRTHPNVAASGEAADYWRHVFYDVRKVHELVWQHEFAGTVLRLASDPARALELPQFLRSGQLAGQQPWAGVLGQSAGAPLFFVVRELCRLEIIPPPALESLRPLAFFPCTPVRRAAVRIGWLGDPSLAGCTDFQSLAEVSKQLYEKIKSDTSVDEATRKKMLNLYDIPLLHLGLKG